MSRPFISVVIPTFNSERFISRALESVFLQDYDNFEVVISDDGSSDKTPELVQAFISGNKKIRARLIKNKHAGPGWCRNQGIEASSGEWIAFLDSDDLWYSDKLSVLSRHIANNPEIGVWCHSEAMRIGVKETNLLHYKKFNPRIDQFLALYRENALSTSAVTVRKESLIKAGLFDESLPLAQDYDLWLRLSSIAQVGFIPEVLGVFVARGDSISSDPAKRLGCYLKIRKKYRSVLKQKSAYYFIEESRFTGRAYSAAGKALILQRKVAQGLFYLAQGLTRWPFLF